MREMKDSGIEWISQVPKTWDIHPVYFYFCERKNKNSLGLEQNLLSLSYGNVIRKNINTVGGLLPESFNTYNIIEANDIVIRPTDLQNDKRSLRTGLCKEHGIITSAYIALKSISDVNVAYVHYLLHTYDIMKVFYNMGNGVRQGLNYSEFSKLMIFLPPLAEQDTIVRFLDKRCDECDTLVSDIQSQIEALEEYKRSVITEAVTKGLDPDVEMRDSGVDYLGKMNAKWKLTKLRYICEKLNRYFKSDAEPLICSNKGEVFPRGDNSVGLVSDNDKMFQGVHKGDLLIHGMDTWHGAIAVSDYDGKCTTVVHVCDSDQNKYFICYFLQMLAIKSVYKAISNGVRENTSDFRSWDKAGHIYITLPPLDEQNRIAEYIKDKIEHINSIIAEKTQQIAAIEEYKKSLIFEFVTGKKEVQA